MKNEHVQLLFRSWWWEHLESQKNLCNNHKTIACNNYALSNISIALTPQKPIPSFNYLMILCKNAQ
jgi:hypothetical protein